MFAHKPLYHAIFERMERNYRHPPAGDKHRKRPKKHQRKIFKLVIYGNAQCLERSGGRMNPGSMEPPWNCREYRMHKLRGFCKLFLSALRDDFAGNLPGKSFLAVFAQYPLQFFLRKRM